MTSETRTPLLILEASAEGTHAVTAGTSSIAASKTTTSETTAAAAVTISVTVSVASAVICVSEIR
jgi:hypothetical protein